MKIKYLYIFAFCSLFRIGKKSAREMSVIARFPKSDPPLTALVTAEFVPQDKKTGIKFTPKNDKDQEITELAFFPQGYKHSSISSSWLYFVSSASS